MYTCEYCEEVVGLTKYHLSSHKRKCNEWKSYVNETLTYEYLMDVYVAQEKSMPWIKEQTGIGYSTIQRKLDEVGIKKRNASEAAKTDFVRESYKASCVEKYGVDNASKSKEIQAKKEKTFISNYGVDNIFKCDWFPGYVDSIMVQRYGKRRITNPDLISERRSNFSKEKWDAIHEKWRNTCNERYGTKSDGSYDWGCGSKLEVFIAAILTDMDVSFRRQFFIARRSFDFYIPHKKMIIEVNGDFWHANPRIYAPSDVLNYPGKGEKTAREVWMKDLKKAKLALDRGYSVHYIWEDDILNDDSMREKLECLVK